jgi:hypothetical protein
LIDGGWAPTGDPYCDSAGNMMVKMRHVIALTLNGRMNVASDSVMSLAEAKRRAPYSSVWSRPLATPQPTLLAGTGFQGVEFSDISNYMENHPGFNLQMGVLEGGAMAVGGIYAFAGLEAVFGAQATGYLGSAMLGAGGGHAIQWYKDGHKVTPRGLGQALSGLPFALELATARGVVLPRMGVFRMGEPISLNGAAPVEFEAGQFRLDVLPGRGGAYIDRSLTADEMIELTVNHGVEFALARKPLPNGKSVYFLYSGDESSVGFRAFADYEYIYHTHTIPSVLSRDDLIFMQGLRKLGNTQPFSILLAPGSPPVRFNEYGPIP